MLEYFEMNAKEKFIQIVTDAVIKNPEFIDDLRKELTNLSRKLKGKSSPTTKINITTANKINLESFGLEAAKKEIIINACRTFKNKKEAAKALGFNLSSNSQLERNLIKYDLKWEDLIKDPVENLTEDSAENSQ